MKKMARSFPLFRLAVFVIVSCISTKAVAEEQKTAYEILASYGFPDGLLPRTVENSGESYALDANGVFELHLERLCRFTVPGNYEVQYAPKIAGSVSSGKLRNLSGISVRILYVWWNIDAITVNGNDLVFQVGPLSASFPADNFDENPMCLGGYSQL
jgi:hypothetical protein